MKWWVDDDSGPLLARRPSKMTSRQFAEAMRELRDNFDDTEYQHAEADMLMCRILRDLGYRTGVKVFVNMDRWYA